MDDQGILKKGLSVSWYTAWLIAVLLAFPASAHAVEVGCFCTFVFASTMFVIGIGLTLFAKYRLSNRIGTLTLKRTSVITVIEVVLFFAVLFLFQKEYYIRVLVYLPFAYLLNYALSTSAGAAPGEHHTPRKRVAMAGFSCLVLPIAVQIMAWLATVLSQFITVKEVRV